jgi:carboxyl-terminal processing protease
MYNGFVSDYDAQLNAAFGEFQAQNIQSLILDLRYNPGGSVNSAAALGSMITGLSSGVFAKLQYNSDLQNNNTDYSFRSTLSEGNSINSVGLDKVYVIATGSSASASEMIINSLKSYIDVVQIGTETVGKSQASITLYDSPNFQRQGANPGHLYALQPLVAITVNKDNQVVPSSGLIPTIEVKENVSNYGVLGDVNEPLLAAALAATQTGRLAFDIYGSIPILDSNSFEPHSQEMYID